MRGELLSSTDQVLYVFCSIWVFSSIIILNHWANENGYICDVFLMGTLSRRRAAHAFIEHDGVAIGSNFEFDQGLHVVAFRIGDTESYISQFHDSISALAWQSASWPCRSLFMSNFGDAPAGT
jgi:hypothetical protein